MDNEVAFSIKESLSKLNTEILVEIYRSPQIQHKVLAAKMHTSPSSLCNILRRLESISPSLINTEKRGRSKYYSLSDAAVQYVETQLLFNILDSGSPSKDNPDFYEASKILQRFQAAAGRSWQIILDDFLSGKGSQQDTLYVLYMDFINIMKRLTLQDNFDAIRGIYALLHQNVLIERLKKCVAAELADHYALKPLFILESQNLEYAILLIDYIFTRIRPDVFQGNDFPDFLQRIPITKPDYQKILFKCRDMVYYFFECKGQKSIALDHWKHTFASCNFSLYYIAEKCHTVYWSIH